MKRFKQDLLVIGVALAPLIACILCVGSLSAGTITVNAGGSIAAQVIQANDTVHFGAGSFDINSTIIPPSGVKFIGVRGKTFLRTTNNGQPAFKLADGRSLSFSGIGFDGGAVACEGSSTLTMDACTFAHVSRGPTNAFPGGLSVGSGGHGGGWKAVNSSITNCSFTDAPGSTAGNCIGWYTCDGFTITDNEFTDCSNALKADNGSDTGPKPARNLDIERNYFARLRRMAAEFQGACDGFKLIDNYYEQPVLYPGARVNGKGPNDDTFAFSVIFADEFTRNCIVTRNYVTSLKPDGSVNKPDGEGLRMVFEIGPGFTVTDNYANGALNFTEAYMGDSTSFPNYPVHHDLIQPTVVQNNRIANIIIGPYAYGADKAKYSATNNGAAVALSWDINRPRPHPGGSITPPPPPPPPPAPTNFHTIVTTTTETDQAGRLVTSSSSATTKPAP